MTYTKISKNIAFVALGVTALGVASASAEGHLQARFGTHLEVGGMRMMHDGTMDGTSTQKRFGGVYGMKPDVIGSIVAISGNTLTVTADMRVMMDNYMMVGNASTTTPTPAQTVTKTIDVSKAVIVVSGATSTVSSLAVGNRVVIVGPTTNGVVMATKVYAFSASTTPGMIGGGKKTNDNDDDRNDGKHRGMGMGGHQEMAVQAAQNEGVKMGFFYKVSTFFSRFWH